MRGLLKGTSSHLVTRLPLVSVLVSWWCLVQGVTMVTRVTMVARVTITLDTSY